MADSKKDVAAREHGDLQHAGTEEPTFASLSGAATRWYFGEWQELAGIDLDALAEHEDVAKFAALKAAGYQQLGDMEQAARYTRLARKLGCDNRTVAQILIAGTHNTFGRMAAIQGNDAEAQKHFRAAIDSGDIKGDSKLALHARSVRELTRLGLLPQAAAIIEEELDTVRALNLRPVEHEARMTMLSSELELVHQQLAQAQQRGQLFARPQSEGEDGAGSRSPSQLGQDVWVLEQTGYKRGGFFVDFGATDGVMLSNTWLLETQFGWRGLAAEPNPKYFKELEKNRSCTVSPACIGPSTGETVEFVLANEFGGIREYTDDDVHAERRRAYEATNGLIEVETISLHDFLTMHDAPRDIDYLSIDTEGSEFAILNAFPFDEWNIRLITVEHNWAPIREEIQGLLEGHGYVRTETQWEDWYVLEPSA